MSTDIQTFPPQSGIYHKVKDGETLWRIAKTYDVDIDQIIRSNNIPNAAVVEVNQLVFIPGADRVRTVVISEEKPEESEGFLWPLKGSVVYYFGEEKDSRTLSGIGIRAYEGQVVNASRRGKVVFADHLPGYAETVIIDHGDEFFSVYSKNAKLLTRVGDSIRQGDAIAEVGKNGDVACLHFEIRKKSKPDNPLFYLP